MNSAFLVVDFECYLKHDRRTERQGRQSQYWSISPNRARSLGRCCTWTAVRTTANGKPEGFAAGKRGAPAAGSPDRAPPCSPPAWRLRRGRAVRQPALPQRNAACQGWEASIRRAARQRARRISWAGCFANRDSECSSAAKAHVGSLDRVTRVVSVKVYLAIHGDIYNQPVVADAASELLHDVSAAPLSSVGNMKICFATCFPSACSVDATPI